MTNGISFVLNAAMCSVSILAAIFAAMFAHRAAESRAAGACSCESKLQSLRGSLDDMAETMQGLADRVKMMKVRSATKHATSSSGEPDPYTNPDGWRKMMNSRMIGAKSVT